MIWSLLHNPVFLLAAPSGAAFLFLVPYALRKERGPAVPQARLLACGLCYEENGEEVHPHPECTAAP